jgi:hypothetical protein
MHDESGAVTLVDLPLSWVRISIGVDALALSLPLSVREEARIVVASSGGQLTRLVNVERPHIHRGVIVQDAHDIVLVLAHTEVSLDRGMTSSWYWPTRSKAFAGLICKRSWPCRSP